MFFLFLLLLFRDPVPIVRADWIVASLRAGQLLPVCDMSAQQQQHGVTSKGTAAHYVVTAELDTLDIPASCNASISTHGLSNVRLLLVVLPVLSIATYTGCCSVTVIRLCCAVHVPADKGLPVAATP